MGKVKTISSIALFFLLIFTSIILTEETVNNFLDKNIKSLKKQGVLVELISNKKDFLYVEKSYKITIKNLENNKLDRLKGMVFILNMSYYHIPYFQSLKGDIYLKSASNNLYYDLSDNIKFDIEKIILDKKIKADFLITNNLSEINIFFKDIEEKLNLGEEEYLKISSQNFNIKDNLKAKKYFSFDKLEISTKFSLVKFKNLQVDISSKDKNIDINYKIEDSTVDIKNTINLFFNKLNLSHSLFLKENHKGLFTEFNKYLLEEKTKLTLDNLIVKTKNHSFKMKKLLNKKYYNHLIKETKISSKEELFDININNKDFYSLKNIDKDIKINGVNFYDIQNIIDENFSIEFKTNIKAIDIDEKKDLKFGKLSINIKGDKEILELFYNPFILATLDIQCDIEIFKEAYELLYQKEVFNQSLNEYKEEIDDKVLFKIKFGDSNLTINNKSL